MGELRVGQIVEVPYGNKVENGIIAQIHAECPIDQASEAYARIRPISRVVTDKILLAPYQIDMITRIASRYMIPIHRVLAIFLTRPILSRLEKKDYMQIEEKIGTMQKE
jgi:primosomal protein N'